MTRDDVERLARARQEARTAKDFATADRLREQILANGYEVTDTPQGFELREARPRDAPSVVRRSPDDVPSVLEDQPTCDVTIHWLAEGWPHDITDADMLSRLMALNLQREAVPGSRLPGTKPT